MRELDIVDEKGRERIVIAAPLPERLVDGKVGHRVRSVQRLFNSRQLMETNKAESLCQTTGQCSSVSTTIADSNGHSFTIFQSGDRA